MAKTTNTNKTKAKKTRTASNKSSIAKSTGTKAKKRVAKKTAGRPVKGTQKKSPTKKSVSTKSKTTKTKPIRQTKKTATKSTTTKSGRKIEVVKTASKPPKKIKGYNKKELEEFKNVILEKRAEIIEQLQNLKDQMMDTTTGQYVNENSPYSLHMAEQGTDAQEREKLYLWAQRETKFLGYLEDALERIEHGTYGICIDSLELKAGPHLVPKNRLLAVPHTQHCVDCKNKKNK